MARQPSSYPYNGKEGQPAYVAVDGVVYDVTNVEAWKDGEHKLGLTAGNELTEEITKQSPHGLKVLEGLPIVGELVEWLSDNEDKMGPSSGELHFSI